MDESEEMKQSEIAEYYFLMRLPVTTVVDKKRVDARIEELRIKYDLPGPEITGLTVNRSFPMTLINLGESESAIRDNLRRIRDLADKHLELTDRTLIGFDMQTIIGCAENIKLIKGSINVTR